MARNRKRSDRRPTGRAAAPGEPGLATARVGGPEANGEAHGEDPSSHEAPSPLRHATPDAELAEAQLAVGRPELAGTPVDEPDLDEAPPAGPPAVREPLPARLSNFVQGSWRELQRVQWPDRRQVMQATGVVIGFVIVAGAYLAVADALAGKIVDAILK